MYVGVVGTPVPIRMQAMATNSRPKKTLPPVSVKRLNGSIARNPRADVRGELDDRAGELEAEPRQRQRAEDQADAGARGADRERVLGAVLEALDQRLPRQRLALQPLVAEPARDQRDVRAHEAQHDAPERRQERREVEQQHRDQRDQRKHEVPALADHASTASGSGAARRRAASGASPRGGPSSGRRSSGTAPARSR